MVNLESMERELTRNEKIEMLKQRELSTLLRVLYYKHSDALARELSLSDARKSADSSRAATRSPRSS